MHSFNFINNLCHQSARKAGFIIGTCRSAGKNLEQEHALGEIKTNFIYYATPGTGLYVSLAQQRPVLELITEVSIFGSSPNLFN
jgi:hypothetical protein